MHQPAHAHSTRRRLLWTLVGTVGLGSTGNIAAVAVGTIAAAELSGGTALSGVPGASVVLGQAAGSWLLSALMVRRGRRAGLVAGYLLGVTGALVAVVAVTGRSLPLLFLGTTLIGFGGASNQLSRYAAADMYPATRRASAIATVVWGATIGAIIGPNLIAPAAAFATSAGLPDVAGAYLIPAVFVGLAASLVFLLLRPDPYALAPLAEPDVIADAGPRAPDRLATPDATAPAAPARIRDVLRRPIVATALVVLVVGQVSMTIVMAMTPLHITEHGGGLAAVGYVMSAHAFGMYALAPVSGRLVDRFGSQRIILLGLTTLATAGLLAASAPSDGGLLLPFALGLLGYGWNLGYVAGSNLLSTGIDLAERTRLQGVTDTIISTSAAVASMTAGLLIAVITYAGLGLLPAFFVMTPAYLLVRRRRALASEADADAGRPARLAEEPTPGRA